MKTNVYSVTKQYTHEGAPSSPIPPIQKLRRLTMACMLWEDTFYVDGKTIVEQIIDCASQISPDKVLELAVEIHKKGMLRHVPLLLIIEALKRKGKAANAIYEVCTRPDQMCELLSLYWKDGKKPLAAQLKKGLAKAFTRFDEYQLAKYNRDDPIKLRDVLFMCHAKPKTAEQGQSWKNLISGGLATPDTWETRLSSGADKKDSFQELLEKGKMGKLAIVRNLRNMMESGVPLDLVKRELLKEGRPILPFQFIAAAKECPQWEPLIDEAMIKAIEGHEKLKGNTAIFVDVSGSMFGAKISSKSKMDRFEAAAGVAILLREICDTGTLFTFSDSIALVPPRQGMALRDALNNSQPHSGTQLGQALTNFKALLNFRHIPSNFDRIIVITDEQTHDVPPETRIPKCYMINVGTYANGIKNNGEWHTISGFSDAVIDYIIELEKEDAPDC